MTDWVPGPALAAYHAGVTVVCQLAAQFTGEAWAAPTPCPEWRVIEVLVVVVRDAAQVPGQVHGAPSQPGEPGPQAGQAERGRTRGAA